MKPSLKEDKQTLKEEDVIRASQRDPSAFRPLYEKYYRTLFRFILYRVADKEVTADLTSQVFLKALLHLDKFQLRGFPFSSWLYRIAINECNDFFRKTKKARAWCWKKASSNRCMMKCSATTKWKNGNYDFPLFWKN
ncbi:MAG: hypothetical protein HC859_05145 [Bacteroidia bacterium]|nr:hypothetical protein [Bacteroidia bacterium]